MKPWKELPAAPNAYESMVISRAKSILTMKGKLGPTLPFRQAMDVVNWYEKTWELK